MCNHRFCWSLALATGLMVSGQAHGLFILSADTESIPSIGETTTIDVRLEATDTSSLIGFNFDLLYDPTIVDVVDVVVPMDNPSGFDLTQVGTVVSPGRLTLGGFRADIFTGIAGSILLASVDFQGLALGVSSLDFDFPGFNPNEPLLSTDGLFPPTPPTVPVLPDETLPGGIAVEVTAVPAAPSFSLLCLGLVTLYWRSRRL